MLTRGHRLGGYEVLDAIGAGGMGEVYRARDLKLNRDVALKILPDAFTHDLDRLARFKREAQVLASLNHPNIAAIYGFEDSNGTQALVLELVDGPTLADRTAEGPIPLDEALPMARQIAEALEAAHEQGIIHRDLKPANIKLTTNDEVKVLDFGLAKAVEPSDLSRDVSQSPTITSPAMTQAGVLLGTAAYMSPEQAKGRPADKRSDIWAFGCVLYEMLTGTRAFRGEDASETLADIIKSEPRWDILPRETPAAIRRLLRRCLHKDRSRRLQHMGDVRLEIDDGVQLQPSSDDLIHGRMGAPRARPVLLLMVVSAAVVAGAFAAREWGAPNTVLVPEMRLDFNTPPTDELTSLALSPDGRLMAFVATTRGSKQLWVRSFDGTPARSLPGTTGAQYPFWSPDSRSIGFFATNKLQVIDVDGGPPRQLANVLTPAGGTWNAQGTILFVPNSAGSVFTVAADGGTAAPNGQIAAHTRGQRFPHFLPDGRHFLVHAGAGQSYGLYVGELGSPEMRRVAVADTTAIYAAGHILFAREGTLLAQRFDLRTLDVSGPSLRVADGVVHGPSASLAASATASGVIAFRGGSGETARRQLMWFDRRGQELHPVGLERRNASNPSLSPNGRYVAVQDGGGAGIGADVWLIDLERNADIRFTDHTAIEAAPI